MTDQNQHPPIGYEQATETSAVERLLGAALAVLVFVAFPLAIDVSAAWRAISTNFYLAPKLWTLATAVVVAGLLLLLSFRNLTLRTLPKAVTASPLVVKGLLGLVVLLLAAAFWGSHAEPVTSVTGSGARFDGVLLFASSFLLFSAFARLSARSPRWLQVASLFTVGTALVVGVLAVLQSFGVQVWQSLGFEGVFTTRPESTIGHRALVSAYTGLVAAHLLGYLGWGTRAWSRGRFLASALVIGVLSFATVLAGGRAGSIALIAAVAVSVVAVAVRAVETDRGRSMLLHLWVAACLAFGFVVASTGSGDTFSRVQAAAGGSDSSWNSRVVTWSLGIEALAEQPLRPYGVGGFSQVAWRHADPEQERQMLREFVADGAIADVFREENSLVVITNDGDIRLIQALYDKAHNYILDMWLSFGLVPTLLYVVLVAAICIQIYRSGNLLARSILLGVLVYAVFAQAWFPTSNLEPIVWSLLGSAWGTSLAGGDTVPVAAG